MFLSNQKNISNTEEYKKKAKILEERAKDLRLQTQSLKYKNPSKMGINKINQMKEDVKKATKDLKQEIKVLHSVPDNLENNYTSTLKNLK